MRFNKESIYNVWFLTKKTQKTLFKLVKNIQIFLQKRKKKVRIFKKKINQKSEKTAGSIYVLGWLCQIFEDFCPTLIIVTLVSEFRDIPELRVLSNLVYVA